MEGWEYQQRKSLPLEMKIEKSIRVIEKFCEKNDYNCYISTAGADSGIVSLLASMSSDKGVRDLERVCVAGVEPVENIRFNYERGDTLLKPYIKKVKGKTILYSKKYVIRKYGYPLIAKEVSMALNRYLHTKSDEVKQKRLYGYMGRNGKIITTGKIPKKYHCFIYAPFEFSENCCTYTKKKPLLEYEKKSKKVPITGEMAEESKIRLYEYLKHGCMMFDKKKIKCTPLGPWTKQDIKEMYYITNEPLSKEYGLVVKSVSGQYEYTGEQRSGCDICGFGMFSDLARFDRLKTKKPKIYNEMIQGGEWIRKNIYRWVKFRPNSIPIWSNLYFVPNKEGYGYRFILNYMYDALNISKHIK